MTKTTERVTDRRLVEAAAAYIELVESGSHRPIPELAEQFGRAEDTMRYWIRTARAEGFLTRNPPGKPGGDLTPRALHLMETPPAAEQQARLCQELAGYAAERHEASTKVTELDAKLTETIAQARKAGVRVVRIAEILGVSRAWIYERWGGELDDDDIPSPNGTAPHA